jgi:hypothetical protein
MNAFVAGMDSGLIRNYQYIFRAISGVETLPGTLGSFALKRMRKGLPAEATGAYCSVAEKQNENFG